MLIVTYSNGICAYHIYISLHPYVYSHRKKCVLYVPTQQSNTAFIKERQYLYISEKQGYKVVASAFSM